MLTHFFVFVQLLDAGALFHPGAYLRDVWNVMDSVVVSCAMISFYFALVLMLSECNKF